MQNRKFMVDRKIHGCFRLTNHIPGHSCPQQRLMDGKGWDEVETSARSRLAADRNVRAPATVSECARPALPSLSVLEPACGSANDYRFLHACGIAQLVDYAGF